MRKKDIDKLLDVMQLLADEDAVPIHERIQLALDFGYYTCKRQYKLSFDKFDERKLEMFKERYWEIKMEAQFEKNCNDTAFRQ